MDSESILAMAADTTLVSASLVSAFHCVALVSAFIVCLSYVRGLFVFDVRCVSIFSSKASFRSFVSTFKLSYYEDSTWSL